MYLGPGSIVGKRARSGVKQRKKKMSERNKHSGGLVKGKEPRLPLGSLRSPIFFPQFFTAEPGPRLEIWINIPFFLFFLPICKVSKSREKKSLRHVTTVEKFLDSGQSDKPKTSLQKWSCTVSNFIDLIQFHFICRMLAKYSGVKSNVNKRKRKYFLCCVPTYCIRPAREMRKFHVAVVQRRLIRNVQTSVMHVQSCSIIAD